MNDKAKLGDLIQQPSVQFYGVLSLCGLLGIVFVQSARMRFPYGMPLILILMLVGSLGIVSRMRSATPVMLLLFAIIELMHQMYFERGRFRGIARGTFTAQQLFNPTHLMLALAFLGYAIGQYRLQSLTKNAFPIDPRLRRRRAREGRADAGVGRLPAKQRRTCRAITTIETALVLMALPVSALAASTFLGFLERSSGFIGFDHPIENRFIFFCWLFFLGLMILRACLRYWRFATMSSGEAELTLQDTLWRETRREQRRNNRWLAWGSIEEKNKPTQKK